MRRTQSTPQLRGLAIVSSSECFLKSEILNFGQLIPVAREADIVSGSRLEVKMKIFAHESYGAKKQLLTKCLAHKKARSMGSGLFERCKITYFPL
jgi:hypothetical protein